MQHPVIQFYLGQRKTQNGMYFDDLLNIPLSIVGDGYFYIPWLFPVKISNNGYISKWNRNIPVFSENDAAFFQQNAKIQARFLQAIDFALGYFLLKRQDNTLTPLATLADRKYWLRNIGHETKKISRLICSLYDCNQPELARNLQTLAIELGQEKGILLPETLNIWKSLLEN